MLLVRDSNVPPKNPLFVELVWGSQRKEQPLGCCMGGAAFAGCHPRPGMDGRHFNGCISRRDTHAVTAAAAVERQPAGSAVSGIPAFVPAPARYIQKKCRTISTSSPRNVARKKHSLKGEGQEGVTETRFSPTARTLRARAFLCSMPSFEPAVTLHL